MLKKTIKRMQKCSFKSYYTILIAISFCLILALQIGVLFSFSKYSNQLSNMIFEDVAKKNVSRMEILLENIEDVVMRLTTKSPIQDFFFSYDIAEKAKNLSIINMEINDSVQQNNNIRFLAVVENGNLSFHASDEERYSLMPLAENIINEFSEKITVKTFTKSYIFNDIVYFALIYHIYPVNASFVHMNNEKNFVIAIYTLDDLFQNSAPSFDENALNIFITDSNNHIMYSTDVKLFDTVLNISKRSLSNTTTLKSLPWNVVVSMSDNATSSSKTFLVTLILIMIIVDILILFIMFRILFNTIVGRINGLKSDINSFTTDRHEYIRYSYSDELTPIVSSINNMLQRIYVLNNEKNEKEISLHKLQLEQEKMQIYYLKGQVSPHFLYNSMMHIQGLALKNHIPEISGMTSAMCKVFRYFTNNTTTTTVEADLYYAIDYFNVINIRREFPIKIEFEPDKSILQLPIIKMVFQPILENIHKHAFSPLNSSAIVSITFENISDEYAAVLISDNGRGIDEIALKQLQNMLKQDTFSETYDFPDNIGLANVNLRLKLHFDKNCGLTISSAQDEGTVVKVIIKKTLKEPTRD